MCPREALNWRPTMGVRKRGKSYFVDMRDRQGRRIRKSVGRVKAVAELFEKDLELKIAREEHLGIVELNRTPFDTYARDWLERKKKTVTLSTWRDYLSILERHLIPHFGRTPICRVSRRDVELFLEKLGGLSAARKNNVMVPLKCLFNEARRREDIRINPCEFVRRFREEKAYIDPFSFPEMRLFLETVDPKYRAYFATAFLTGMRPNELIALKWGNVDFDLRVVTVREGRVQGVEGPPKTLSSYRDIDMLDPLFEVLSGHRRESPPDARYVFSGTGGRPLEVNNLRNRVWKPALSKAGLRLRTMYQTRHTFASLMLSYGEDPLWVARMLGHTSTEMLYRHYGKFIRNRMRRDGMKFLKGLEESGLPESIMRALPAAKDRKGGDGSDGKE
jgi:integrase